MPHKDKKKEESGGSIPITGEDISVKSADKNKEQTPEENVEKILVQDVIDHVKKYKEDRQETERQWTESYKSYKMFVNRVLNPFLSNLFIPKVHEAVELLSAFLIGTNQSITVGPENTGDSKKSMVAERYLGFMWRKTLKARLKILTWIKQGIIFGNGILKVGWDGKKTFMVNTSIEDVYFDYFVADMQESEMVIHLIRRDQNEVMNDEKYDEVDKSGETIRSQVIVGGTEVEDDVMFATYDEAIQDANAEGKVIILEAHRKEHDDIVTIAPTGLGWRILRTKNNPYKYHMEKDADDIPFRPFVKFRFKVQPLPNRAYDISGVWPTVGIQNAFNDLMRQYSDNVTLINNSMWLKRKGAKINPRSLIRRPGGVITVSDIDKDLKPQTVADVKGSVTEMLNRLDREFQEASMVSNLLKGIGGDADTATEAQLGQENTETLLDMIDENISDALSEVGQMILAIEFEYVEEDKTIKMFENDAEIGILKFKPNDIKGFFDLEVKPDRSSGGSSIVRSKQLIDFAGQVGQNEGLQQRFPNLLEKILRRWLKEQKIPDIDFFFEKEQPIEEVDIEGEGGDNITIPGKGNTPGSIREDVSPEKIIQDVLKG